MRTFFSIFPLILFLGIGELLRPMDLNSSGKVSPGAQFLEANCLFPKKPSSGVFILQDGSMGAWRRPVTYIRVLENYVDQTRYALGAIIPANLHNVANISGYLVIQEDGPGSVKDLSIDCTLAAKNLDEVSKSVAAEIENISRELEVVRKSGYKIVKKNGKLRNEVSHGKLMSELMDMHYSLLDQASEVSRLELLFFRYKKSLSEGFGSSSQESSTLEPQLRKYLQELALVERKIPK